MLSNLIQSMRRKPGPADLARRFAAAREAFNQDDLDYAQAEFTALTLSDSGNPEVWLYAGMCAYKLGNAPLALQRVQRARELDPRQHEFMFQEAIIQSTMGALDQTRALCIQALKIEPRMSAAYLLWSMVDLPGDDYLVFLARLHQHLKPRTYLEIGVFQGKSLRMAGAATRAIGVDPEPKISEPLPSNARVFELTSDEFFARHDVVRDEFGGDPVELAFIDGMHLFEYALRDFINIERCASPNGAVLIHDCYPLDRASAERERHAQFWSGDIWRMILVLKKYRPDLRVCTLALAPTGLGLVRRLDPHSTVLADRYDAIVAEFKALDYAVLEQDKPGMLGLFPNNWDHMIGLFENREVT